MNGLLQQVLAGQAPPIFSLSVDQLHRMQEEGILASGEAVELIEGILVRKDRGVQGETEVTHHPLHAAVVGHCYRWLDRRLDGTGCHVRSQLPVTLNRDNEPEPDLTVVVGDPEAYSARHPTPAEVVLLIEVAHSSLQYDRTTKLHLYAAAGIERYWIVDLVARQIEEFSSPTQSGTYARHAVYRAGSAITWDLPSGPLQIPVDEFLPARFFAA